MGHQVAPQSICIQVAVYAQRDEALADGPEVLAHGLRQPLGRLRLLRGRGLHLSVAPGFLLRPAQMLAAIGHDDISRLSRSGHRLHLPLATFFPQSHSFAGIGWAGFPT